MTLSCDASGNPVPTISWTKDGSPLHVCTSSRIGISGDKKKLHIKNLSRTDRGEYRCVASNEVGTDESNAAILDIQCKCGVSSAFDSCGKQLVWGKVHLVYFRMSMHLTM